MASEPRFSISPRGERAGPLALVDVRQGLARFHSRLGLILRRTFRLNLRGKESAVVPELAVGERLSAVLEGVGERIAALVGHSQAARVLHENEDDLLAGSLDGPGLDVP